jgi:hypothetical protein
VDDEWLKTEKVNLPASPATGARGKKVLTFASSTIRN